MNATVISIAWTIKQKMIEPQSVTQINLDVWMSQYELAKWWVKCEAIDTTPSAQNKLQQINCTSQFQMGHLKEDCVEGRRV